MISISEFCRQIDPLLPDTSFNVSINCWRFKFEQDPKNSHVSYHFYEALTRESIEANSLEELLRLVKEWLEREETKQSLRQKPILDAHVDFAVSEVPL